MVDVGASTLDCCTFSLTGDNGVVQCPIFLADVSLRGVQPWECCDGEETLKADFEQDVQYRQKAIIWLTRLRRDPNSERWRTGMPVFLIGGGAAAEVYQKTSGSLDPWLKRNVRGSNGVRLLTLPEPDDLEYSCTSELVQRLAVGIGLSHHVYDIANIVMPSEIEDVGKLRVREIEDIYGK
jgi:hypothetical protein